MDFIPTGKAYNVKYSCGCIHELQEGVMHEPTGKNKHCKDHK